MTVAIKPNSKCCRCQNYVDGHCLARSVPRFCGKRYAPREPSPGTRPTGRSNKPRPDP